MKGIAGYTRKCACSRCCRETAARDPKRYPGILMEQKKLPSNQSLASVAVNPSEMRGSLLLADVKQLCLDPS